MTSRRLGLGMALLSLALPRSGAAVDRVYEVPTLPVEGRASCTLRGTIKDVDEVNQLQVTVAPTAGEALLEISLDTGVSSFVAAGFQPGCDIFPPSPSTVALPLSGLTPKVKVLGVLDLHAHPGADCAAGSVATGTVSALVTAPASIKLKKLLCDSDPTHANLQLRGDRLATATRASVRNATVLVENHGPGDATGTTLDLKLPKSFFPRSAVPSQGSCIADFRKHRVHCDLGTVGGFFGTADVDLELIPLKEGRVKTTESIAADNNGKVFDRKEKLTTDVGKGASSILRVNVKCKGAGGTVTIDPNGAGGVTTCSCPDPADATKEEVTCIELYAQKTTVTLTPAATKGAFDKWKDDCAGNPAACNVTVDPSSPTKPDATATAKFK